MKRRDFLKGALACGSLVVTPRLSATAATRREPGARTLVLLHLEGGNDGLNTVIPFADPRYARLRPGLAIRPGQVRRLDERLGLHPSLGGFEALWRREQLAIVHGVGYPNPDYSHFRATEIWLAGDPETDATDGWIGRTLEANPSASALRAVAFANEPPLSFEGTTAGVATLTAFDRFRLPPGLERIARLYERSSSSEPLGAVARAGADAVRLARRIASLTPVPGPFYGRLGDELRKVAALIESGIDVEVIQIAFDGFDTHANQAATHADLLQALGTNLQRFQERLEEQGLADRVVTLVFSEFGRRPEENASGGTDHGAAAPVFLVGAPVRPGFVGRQPSLEDLDGGNLRFTTDFRAVYAAVLRDFLGRDPAGVVSAPGEPLELFA